MNQKHRIFIAINLPENIKKRLAEYQEKWPELDSSIRWTKKDNLHVTLVFVGYIDDNELLEVMSDVKEAVSKHSSFLINLNKFCYGPLDKIPPKMIWAVGEKSDNFVSLREGLAQSLGILEKRVFSPHITLGRIKQFEWRRIEPEERPEIEKDVSLSFEVDSVDIMESVLKRGGPEYTILESYKLKI